MSKKAKLLNNNNNNRNNGSNNNRRRGRNNNSNRGGGGGGGNQGNRIDSRARGNAPQMLEKYRKLAHDASLNDDRVLTEYYLQFADHYFRVMADMKAQRDDQQQQRPQGARRDFDEDGGELEREDEDDGRSRQYQPQQYQPQQRAPRNDYDEGSEGEADEGDNPFSPAPRQQSRPEPRSESRREPRAEPRREPRPEPRREPREEQQAEAPAGERTRQPRKPVRRREEPQDDGLPLGLSADMLPPAIARADEGEGDVKPARKPLRVRTKRPPASEGGEEALEAVG